MVREIIIILVIIISIVVVDYITQNFTKESVENTSNLLRNLKTELEQRNSKSLNKILEEWNKRKEKLAYFIEHDELEKVETNLINIKSSIELNDLNIAFNCIDETVFMLEHIKDKNSFNLENIF